MNIFVVLNCNINVMSLFSDNIRNLRLKQKISQEKLAENLSITRGRYVKYEDGTSEPPYDILKRISFHFNVSIDLLLSVDVQKVTMDSIMRLGNRMLLPITVDRNGENTIEIIPHKAKAGYQTGYADPEFIENLQQVSLPWLGSGKFRGFPIDGDSMPPHNNKSFIIGRYVEKLGDVVDGKTYILLTKSQGIVYKRLNKNGKNTLVLNSDNKVYAPYEVKASEIMEIWEYECSIETEKFKPINPDSGQLMDMFMNLRQEIREVKERLH